MERCTIRLKTGEARCSQLDGNVVVERLAAYEDSGLSPEDAANLHAILRLGDGMTLMRLRELAEADKDGRCVVLPCKVGDTIWRLKRTFETYPDKSKPYTEADGFLLQDIWNVGKNVFMTREEAEKALQGMEE